MPLHRRCQARFTTFPQEFNIVSLERLVELGEETITPDVLRKAGVIKPTPGKGARRRELKCVDGTAHKFSSQPRKITKAAQGRGLAVNVEKWQHLPDPDLRRRFCFLGAAGGVSLGGHIPTRSER